MERLNHLRLEPYISAPRLSTYRAFFAPKNDVELLGCYLWNKEVASAFFPLLQLLEITLRNAIHKEASHALGSFWFDHLATRSSNKLSAAQNNAIEYHHRSIKQARNDIRRELKLSKSASVSEDRIIAKVTFGFWTNVFNTAFDVNRDRKALWPALLRPVFYNAPQGVRDRHVIQDKLISIRGFRNKAFHHEPIWNIGQPVSVHDAVKKLHETKNLILEILRWISLDVEELVYKAGYVDRINRICSEAYLSYLKYPSQNSIPLSRAKRELQGILRISNGDCMFDITRNKIKVGKLYHSR